MSKDNVTDVHRVVKEVLEKLVFSCPRCNSVKRTYTEIFKHMETCEGAAPLNPQPVEKELLQVTPIGPGSLVPGSL